MKGTIRCAKCDKKRTEMVCSCGWVWCKIRLYHQGRQYAYTRDGDGRQLTYNDAAELHIRIFGDYKQSLLGKRHFDPTYYTAGKIRERFLEQQVGAWLAKQEPKLASGEMSHETIKNYRGYAKHYYIPLLGQFDVTHIDSKSLEGFKDSLPSTLKLKTKRNIVNGLRTFFTHLHREGTIQSIPPFPIIKGNDAGVRVALDIDDQGAALNNIPEKHRAPFVFMMETGVRPGELCALKIKDLDMKRGAALIQRTWSGSKLRETTKGHNKRWIPLTSRALATLDTRGRFGEDWVFINPNTGGEYRPKRLYLLWREHSNTGVDLYAATRHSFCTQVVESGANSMEAQALMRHSDVRTTSRYYHCTTRRLKDIVESRGRVCKIKTK